MKFPISCATVEPDKWFSGRCLASLSPPDDSPEQQIAAAQVICDQARALIGNTLGQDPMEFAGWRTHVHARCMILAAGTCAEQLAFPGIAPLDNGMDKALSRIYDPETGLFWVDDSLSYPRLVCEARTADGLRRRIAKLLDTNVKNIELRLPASPRRTPSRPLKRRANARCSPDHRTREGQKRAHCGLQIFHYAGQAKKPRSETAEAEISAM